MFSKGSFLISLLPKTHFCAWNRIKTDIGKQKTNIINYPLQNLEIQMKAPQVCHMISVAIQRTNEWGLWMCYINIVVGLLSSNSISNFYHCCKSDHFQCLYSSNYWESSQGTPVDSSTINRICSSGYYSVCELDYRSEVWCTFRSLLSPGILISVREPM